MAESELKMQAFDEDAEVNDEDIDQEPEMKFFATGNDGKVIKLHQRIASVPISMGGIEFQKALEEEIKDYTDDEVIALAPFELVGRGIAGIEEMAQLLDDHRVMFGLLQVQIGEGTFARYKNIFIHFQGEKLKILARARANKKLAVAKELIGHTHAPLVVPNQETFTLEWVFDELKRVFTGDSIAGYESKGKQQDITTLRVNYQKRMEQAKLEAKEERKRLKEERIRMEKEAKQKALEEEKEKLLQLKREAEEEKKRKLAALKQQAEEERRLRHEQEEKERLARKLQKEEEEKKAMEEAKKENPNASPEELKKTAKKKRRKGRKKRKKKDDWSDDKPWTPQRVLACIHAEMSPINWGLFKPSQTDIIPIKWGHGSLQELREELKADEVMYGMMRLSFGADRFRRSHWVYFLWTPDTMSIQYKKNKKRMKHVSYNGKMQKILAPWTVSLTVETLEKVTIADWINRVKKTVVVDGNDEISEEAFRKALEAENQWIQQQKDKEKEMIEQQKAEEEKRKVEDMKEASRKRQEVAQRKQSNVYTKIKLKEVDSNGIGGALSPIMSPTQDADGNYYVNHDVDYDALKAQAEAERQAAEAAKAAEAEEEDDDEESSEDEKPREPSPEPVIELSEEELQLLEEARKRKEAEELAKRTENEMKYRNVLKAKLVLESVELVKRGGEKLCWVLLAPKDK